MLNIQTPFLNSERDIQLKVTIGSETLLSEDIISFSITATMGDSYTIGNFTSRELDLEILTDSAPAAVKGQMIIPYVICGNQELKLGVFYADANGIEVDRKTMSIKAYDVLSKLGAGALSLSVAYEQTPLSTAVNLLLGIMGTTLSMHGQALINNSSFRIDIPIGGNTIQRTMRAVAACLGSTAIIDVNGKLDFIKPNSLNRINISAGEYVSFKTLSDEIFTIGGITLTIKSEDTSIPDTVYSYGDTTHNLINLDWDESNVLKNQADITAVALAVGIPFSYYGYQLNTIGLPFVELGDYIRLTDFDNNTYNLPVLSYTHTFDKGITSTFAAKIPSSGTIAAGASGGGGSITQAINNLNITTIQTKALVAETIEANEARFNELDADKADIDLLNVDVTTITEAWIKDLMVQGGMIAQDGTFYKLIGAKVYGDVIEANTVKADSLILQGQNGLYYAINVDALGQTTASSDIKYQEGIDGKIIVAHSITADEITANNIQGTGGWINLASGTFSYNNATSGNYITWDGTDLRIKTSGGLIEDAQGFNSWNLDTGAFSCANITINNSSGSSQTLINSNTIKSIDTNLKNAAVIRDGEIGLFSYQNISDIDDSTKAYGLLTTNSSGCFLTAGSNYDITIGQLDVDGAPGDYFFRGNSNGSWELQGTKSYNAQILGYDPNSILISSGNGFSTIDLTNSEVEITANQVSIIDLTSSLFSVTVNRTDRIIANSSTTNIFSPDGVTSSIKLTNTAMYICCKDHDVVVYNNNGGYAYLGNSWTGTKTYFCAGIADEYLYIQGKVKYRTDSNNSWRTLSW